MSIQFHCLACGQPIEVDDDAANQPVTCPYCRRVSTAPAMTAPNFDARARTAASGSARPIDPSARPTFQGSSGLPSSPIPTGNTLGLVALGLMFAAVLLIIPTSKIAAPIQESVQSIQDPKERSEALSAEVMKHPELILLSVLSSCMLPLIATVLATIALVRKRTPRWPAYTTLGLVTVGILLSCLGMIAQTMGGGV